MFGAGCFRVERATRVSKPIFSRWSNNIPPLALGGALTTMALVIGIVWYYFTPKFWEVGYMPTQPGAGFSHRIHVGKLGMDCRYCHSHVDESRHSNVPTVHKCMNCHTEGRLSADLEETATQTGQFYVGSDVGADGKKISKVQFIRDAYEKDASIPWRKIHKLPDYVHFPHQVHVTAGVSCYSCHGPIGRMEVVHQAEPLSMGWCLECHRNPEPNLVDPEFDPNSGVRMVYDLFAVERSLSDKDADGARTRYFNDLQEAALHRLPENCGACHY